MPMKPKRQLLVTHFFSTIPRHTTKDVPPLIESDGEDEVATNHSETQGSAPPLVSDDKCIGALPPGIPNANAICSRHPTMRHAYEKIHRMYVDGMGILSLDPPCTRLAHYGEFGVERHGTE